MVTFDPQMVSEYLARQVHDETHAKPGKLTHIGCRWCREQFTDERLVTDAVKAYLEHVSEGSDA